LKQAASAVPAKPAKTTVTANAAAQDNLIIGKLPGHRKNDDRRLPQTRAVAHR
jgi:hypothetical protein